MIFAWIVLASTGMLFARYFKFIFPKIKPFNLQFWFVIHRSFMTLTLFIALAALFFILWFKNWKWVDMERENFIAFGHSIVGIVAIGLTFAQPILAFFRPDKEAPRRSVFNWTHKIVGFLTYFLASEYLILKQKYENIKRK